jgi:hypothetical protein
MRRLSFMVVGVVAATMLFAGIAMAGTIDPQIFIGPPGTNTPQGGTAIGGESNLLVGTSSGTGFVAGVAGDHTMQDPLLIIFGAYPGSAASPTLGFTGCPASGCPAATVGTYGLTANTASFSSGNAYETVGLTETNSGAASESFVNWTAADALNGFPAPSSYTLDVFAVPTGLTGTQAISLSEKGLAAGSFIIAYSCEITSTPAGGPCDDGQVGATPFTNAGLVTTSSLGGPPPPPPPPPPPTTVPEPMGLPVVGIAITALAIAWKRRSA